MLPLVLFFQTPPAYHFTEGIPERFETRLGFNGFLPLFGGQKGKAYCTFTTAVVERMSPSQGLGATVALESFRISFNGFALPVTLQDAKKYFPDSNFQFSEQGEILKAPAPSRPIPVKLPGLDLQKIPEVSFLPVRFPDPHDFAIGRPFEFSEQLGGGKADWTVTPVQIKGQTLIMAIKFHQEYKNLEDDAYMVTTKREDEARSVSTVVDGEGTGKFDVSAGRFDSFVLNDDSKSVAKDVTTGKVSHRELRRSLTIKYLGQGLQTPLKGLSPGSK